MVPRFLSQLAAGSRGGALSALPGVYDRAVTAYAQRRGQFQPRRPFEAQARRIEQLRRHPDVSQVIAGGRDGYVGIVHLTITVRGRRCETYIDRDGNATRWDGVQWAPSAALDRLIPQTQLEV